MARKKKRVSEFEPEPKASAPPPVGTSMRDLLKGMEIAKPEAKKKPEPKKPEPPPPPPRPVAPIATTPARDLEGRPSETLRGDDRIAYLDALAGVRPMSGRGPRRLGAVAAPPGPPKPEERNRDAAARARLASLVAGGVHFDVYREEGWIEGIRRDAKPSLIDALYRATVGSEATLDLHGIRAGIAGDRVTKFVRDAQRAGMRRVLIVHGKGLHSEDGNGVLADVVVGALTEGGAAPLVIAFCTAPQAQGGAGALLVELTKR
ncbi:Smr/MutS family protein [Sandaracinus amylolyticus]|uniref:Smr/MutS family protein n=1 Tax=Sandaracinus amylolyticus TaxID=927083 RepID=UPI001F2BF011|nr:Smr/MutS family protein [Sandaracinus amylolyticus]